MYRGWLKLAPITLLLAGACTGFGSFWGKKPADADAEKTRPTAPCEVAEGPGSGAVRLEMQEVRYDGAWLSGRLLISPVAASVILDKRLLPYHSVYIHSVSDCETGQPVKHIEWDGVPPPTQETDRLTLGCGYWYGATVRFHVFMDWVSGTGPECISADLTLFSSEGQPLGHLPVRATRAALETLDGGVPEEVPPAPDAGAGQ